MSCTTCGSNTTCGCSSTIVGVVLNNPGCGPSSSSCQPECCENTVNANPTPFYNCAPSCAEGHNKNIFIQQFTADIKIQDSWNVPGCGLSATITSVELQGIVVGSYIWNPAFGYFEVTAFNPSTNQITVVNHCNEVNAAPGTNVPSCTEFTVTVPPVPDTPTSDSCVAIDFTAPPPCPAAGCTINITITNLGSISTGDIIQIGTGRYTVTGIVSTTVITISNDLGLGITPGTPIIARDAAGNYQYCITVAQSCCAQIEAEFPDGLTPCSNFQNDTALIDSPSSITTTVTVGPLTTVFSNISTLVITNQSTCRTMTVLVNIGGYANDIAIVGGVISGVFELQESTDGGAYSTVLLQNYVLSTDTFAVALPLQLFYSTTRTLLATVSTTLRYKIKITNNNTTRSFDVQQMIVRGTALGVAV